MSLGYGILGAIIGAAVGGPLGGIIGAGIGSLVGNSSKNESNTLSNNTIDGPTIHAYFQCLGKLAKADGRVSLNEAELAGSILDSLNITGEMRTILKMEFNQGRDSNLSFEELVQVLANHLKRQKATQYANIFSESFCMLAIADHVVSNAEKQMLITAGDILGTRYQVEEFLLRYTTKKQRTSPITSTSQSITKSYEILGVKEDATNEEVKKAWKKKAMEFHPDKVQGSGLSDSFIEFAKQKFQDVNNAYDNIAKARGIK